VTFAGGKFFSGQMKEKFVSKFLGALGGKTMPGV
jgi:hypothetical protein